MSYKGSANEITLCLFNQWSHSVSLDKSPGTYPDGYRRFRANGEATLGNAYVFRILISRGEIPFFRLRDLCFMDSSTILQSRVASFFSETLHIDVPLPGMDLVRTGVLDSLALVELILFVEQEFRFEVPLDEIDHFRSIESIAALIASRVAIGT